MRAGDYLAAAASHQQALALYRDIGHRPASATANLGTVQFRTGDYPAAAASLTQALGMFRDIGDRRGRASATGNLGSRAIADRGLPGRRRQPKRGAGHVSRPRLPGRPG